MTRTIIVWSLVLAVGAFALQRRAGAESAVPSGAVGAAGPNVNTLGGFVPQPWG